MFEPIENLFTRRMKRNRGEVPDTYSYEIPENVRRTIIGYVLDTNLSFDEGHFGRRYDELEQLAIVLDRQFGKSISGMVLEKDQILDFMSSCSTEEFLAALEILCKLKATNINKFTHYQTQALEKANFFISSTNKLFRLERIGYELVPAGLEDLPFIVVPFNSQYLHLETIKKPRELLHNKKFDGALDEFETALDKLRQEDYDGSVQEAINAYESTLKTILDIKGVSYNSGDKIPGLVNKVMEKLDLDSCFNDAFGRVWSLLSSGPNTIRNLEGVAHGQGSKVKKLKREYAEFVLRTVGTYIVFLIERLEGA